MTVRAATAGLSPETASLIERIVAGVPDPQGALTSLSRLRETRPNAFDLLSQSRTSLVYLTHALAYSRALANDILRNPHWVGELADRGNMSRVYLTEEYVERLLAFLGEQGASGAALALFRRRSILRILLRDVLAYGTLAEITEDLSNLADAVLEVAHRSVLTGLVKRHGEPNPPGFAVIALGKHGGRELNYSSDIDLMFLYAANGETTGPRPTSNKEFFNKLSTQMTAMLSTHMAEGLCYRVDLRLRPEGSLGEVCASLDSTKAYYTKRARDWELQMLIKARVAAGDSATGREFLDFVEPLIYDSTLDFSAVEVMSATRDRMDSKLAGTRGAKGTPGFDVKLARGGIRDIEFLVQCLQRLHGGRVPWVRHGGTLLALFRLHDKGLLSAAEYSGLASAYEFLRHLEHRLQIVEDRQTHVLPSAAVEMQLLAARMPRTLLGEPTTEGLLSHLNGHLEQVTAIYERVIHAHNKPLYYSGIETQAACVPTSQPAPAVPNRSEPAAGNLIRSLDETAPALAAAVARAQLSRGLRAFEHFLERASLNADLMRSLEQDGPLARAVLDIFENSPYFSEQLSRDPELIREIGAAKAASFYYRATESLPDPAALRRFFRCEMVRLQAASIRGESPIFETLGRTSDLADATIAAAYRIAVGQALAARPAIHRDYRPLDQMMVVALGRLGMREFDLASDADLVFVLPDSSSAELLFWTRVAERTIDLLTAYTGEGVLFAIDTRLRPNGSAGELVQSVAAYKDYFARSAAAWEGIAWMKSRAIAGNMKQATRFLHELQDVDWRRYGQNGRSRSDLRQMRARLEREQGTSHPLKAGRGGYYDIDFVLMYLRLKGAGMFFKVLNTPKRIEVLEQMGHLDRDDAAFLYDAATFYRAVDHALRVFSGQAEGSLPQSEGKLAALEDLVRRWTPPHLHDAPLRIKAGQIQQRTRQLFDRLFS